MAGRLILTAGAPAAGSTTLAVDLVAAIRAGGAADDKGLPLVVDLDRYDGASARIPDLPAELRCGPEELARASVPPLLHELLGLAGLDDRIADEAMHLPGADLIAAGLIAHRAVSEGRTVVVDAGSRLVDLVVAMDQARWMALRLLPAQRGWLTATRPRVASVVGSWWPGERIGTAVGRASETLRFARRTLAGGRVAHILGDSPRTEQLRVGVALTELPAIEVSRESVSPTELLGALGEPVDGSAAARIERQSRRGRSVDGDWLWVLPLPTGSRLTPEQLGVRRLEDDLIVSAYGYRRLFTLPTSLRRCAAVGATVRSDRLEVRFSPDDQEYDR